MAYQLGIDLGTTYTAAAVLRQGRAEIASLGDRAAAIPSVIFVRPDESILTGEAASRRGLSEPARVAHGFKRRLGDPTPILLGGTPFSPETLMAKLLVWTVQAVAEHEGAGPDAIAVSHPANWGPYKKDLLQHAIRLADLSRVKTLSEPEAAAIYYASTERIDVGDVVAVYDLGGGTFDAAVLRKTTTGFDILGPPEGIEHLGGMDFDEAVIAHVDRALDGALTDLDPDDEAAVAIMARFREECTVAKEVLSSDTDVSIPVLLPNLQTEVRLTRAEFEAMIRSPLADTIAALRRALRSSNVEPEELQAVLLVGGSSRIPMVGQLVSAELGRPVKVDAHPKYAIALGAALVHLGGRPSKPVLRPETHDVRSTRVLTDLPPLPPRRKPSTPASPRQLQRQPSLTKAIPRDALPPRNAPGPVDVPRAEGGPGAPPAPAPAEPSARRRRGPFAAIASLFRRSGRKD